MFEALWGLFGKKSGAKTFTDEQYSRHAELKRQGMENVLGKMHDTVQHAIIPYDVGGPVDLFFFPQPEGTCLATMELIRPDGTGPVRSTIGTYELVAFTRCNVGDEAHREAFKQISGRLTSIFTTIGHYSEQARLDPFETVEVPADDDLPNYCLILDEYRAPGKEFRVGGRKHGLLLVVEVYRTEMLFAMENGTKALIDKLKEGGHYPFSDRERRPVV